MLYDSYRYRRRASYKSTPCPYASSTVSHDWFCIYCDWGQARVSRGDIDSVLLSTPRSYEKHYLLLDIYSRKARFLRYLAHHQLLFPYPTRTSLTYSIHILNRARPSASVHRIFQSIPPIRHSFSSRMTREEIDAPLRGSNSTIQCYPYECSSASMCSSSSSSSSIFSQDDRSSQSSAPSSSKSFLNIPWDSDPSVTYELPKVQPRETEATQASVKTFSQDATVSTHRAENQVPKELRQHPRRTQPVVLAGSDGEPLSATCIRPPPLVRQCERKDSFVENLVGELT